MFVVKYNFFSKIKAPISATLFGENKTWRGFIFIPITNSILLTVLNLLTNLNLPNATIIGFLLGFAYVLFELPNSFFKRRFGIKPGLESSKNKLLFKLTDKMDSSFGVTLFYFILQPITIIQALLIFSINVATHIIFSLLLVKTKLKSSF
jgi:CDP-diglyceride synthetase